MVPIGIMHPAKRNSMTSHLTAMQEGSALNTEAPAVCSPKCDRCRVNLDLLHYFSLHCSGSQVYNSIANIDVFIAPKTKARIATWRLQQPRTGFVCEKVATILIGTAGKRVRGDQVDSSRPRITFV